jgi:galactokinase
MLNHASALGLPPRELALVGQSAEHWVGVNCGIMDQARACLFDRFRPV